MENGRWCVNQFLSAKRQDLAVRMAILGDLFLESGELGEMVREVPTALFLVDSPLRQGMKMAFGKPASRITLGELQEVTYLSVGGNTVFCAFGPEGGPENAVSITVDREIRGVTLAFCFFRGFGVWIAPVIRLQRYFTFGGAGESTVYPAFRESGGRLCFCGGAGWCACDSVNFFQP